MVITRIYWRWNGLNWNKQLIGSMALGHLGVERCIPPCFHIGWWAEPIRFPFSHDGLVVGVRNKLQTMFCCSVYNTHFSSTTIKQCNAYTHKTHILHISFILTRLHVFFFLNRKATGSLPISFWVRFFFSFCKHFHNFLFLNLITKHKTMWRSL